MKRYLPNYTQGFPGSTGKDVYYNYYGQTNMHKRTGTYNKIPTDKQYIWRARFAEAVRFAKSVIADPVLKELYTKMAGKRCSAYSMAVSEYLLVGNGQWIL